MLAKFLPRQEEFFQLFGKMAGCLTQAAQAFYQHVQQLSETPGYVEQILQLKKETEGHARRVFTLLHKTFITPFDRYDIHRLNARLYDIANMINLTAQRFPLYQIHQAPPLVVTLAEVCYESSKLVEQVVSQLHDLKNHAAIVASCQQIKAYESQADHLLIEGTAALLREENDFKNILKFKEIYDLQESITDRCQEVAFIVEGIVLEYA